MSRCACTVTWPVSVDPVWRGRGFGAGLTAQSTPLTVFYSLKSSRYLPVPEHVSQRSSSLSSNMDPSRKKDVKSKQNDNTKRRATMNSRGAYDEDEMLRRAIEESKETGSLGKRTRDDSDEYECRGRATTSSLLTANSQKQSAKRQRTGSSSPSTGSKHSQSPPPDAEDASARNSVNGNRNGGQKLRGGAVARTNREKELREKQKEQQAAQRAEAVNKRNARSERRRGDGTFFSVVGFVRARKIFGSLTKLQSLLLPHPACPLRRRHSRRVRARKQRRKLRLPAKSH